MESQIFGVIDEMEEYISNCKGKMFSSTEIICNRDKMEEFLRELRRKAPEEIEQCRKVIARKEAIYSDAKEKAEKLMNETMVQSDELVSQNQIMRRAYTQADEVIVMAKNQAQSIVDNATSEANEIRNATTRYMEDVMIYLENFLDSSIKDIDDNYSKLLSTVNAYAERIRSDHMQLHPEETADSEPIQEAETETAAPENTEQ